MRITRTRRPEGDPHFEDIRCTDCSKHMGFGKKPETLEREARNEKRIKQLQAAPQSEWNKGFLASIAKLAHLSPKQQAKLDEIWQKNSA